MIPQKIHYCWFGGKPLPKSALKCIASWRKFLPDYEIVEWNERNFDFRSIPYISDAYDAGKYAFVSDYARFKILYEHGGLYFDTDVELIRPIDDIIRQGAFMGFEADFSPENVGGVNPGLGLGVEAGNPIYGELLEKYKNLKFRNPDGSLNLVTIVKYTTDLLIEYGLESNADIQMVEGISVYPKEYFNPFDMKEGRPRLTKNTRSIHWYSSSWESKSQKLKRKMKHLANRLLGKKAIAGLKKMFS